MKKELWIRLRDYHFDNLVPPHLTDRVAAVFGGVDAPTQAFASKLSRKHGWTARFARHAIREYKKFVYLGVTNTIKVTPSKVIDVVWHEHLLFSRPYREFCDDVLERSSTTIRSSSPRTTRRTSSTSSSRRRSTPTSANSTARRRRTCGVSPSSRVLPIPSVSTWRTSHRAA